MINTPFISIKAPPKTIDELQSIMDFLGTYKKSTAIFWAIHRASQDAELIQGKVKASNIGKVESNTNTQE